MRETGKKSWLFAAMFVLMLLLAACGKQESVQPQPVDEAVDTCAQCHMTVKNNGYAAQYVTEDGKSVKFDDIGCLYKHTVDHAEEKMAGMFVQDRGTRSWVPLKEASYVQASNVPTPMGYGIHAFTEKASAEAFIKEKGRGQLLTYEQLQQHEWKMDKHNMLPQEGMQHGGMKHGDGHKQ
ncbi:nitrous oxide reductase accessory protein NosL [Aneurinibacillus sp. BA2021]|nr:nitrous oxide reductase accessory protein NosL [Aneurinibacillus sp. BA2021]